MTDWWGAGATILAGIITAIATIIAVVYTNRKTKQQLIAQEEKFTAEQKKQNKLAKYVVIKPSYLLTTFTQILDNLIISNDYNRVLLFSGDDGFDFYDNTEKQNNQLQRVLMIKNQSPNEIHKVKLKTHTELINSSTNAKVEYSTTNYTGLLRSGEIIIIRLTNQEQFDTIIDLNKKGIGSDLKFTCAIEYETLGEQRITYTYQLHIRDDKRIDVAQDGIDSVIDIDNQPSQKDTQSVFRNLQDYLPTDRSAYAWQKMGQAQMTGALQIMQQRGMQQMNVQTQPSQNPDK